MKSKAYREGVAACCLWKDADACPYALGTQERCDWMEGHTDAKIGFAFSDKPEEEASKLPPWKPAHRRFQEALQVEGVPAMIAELTAPESFTPPPPRAEEPDPAPVKAAPNPKENPMPRGHYDRSKVRKVKEPKLGRPRKVRVPADDDVGATTFQPSITVQVRPDFSIAFPADLTTAEANAIWKAMAAITPNEE